jgi:hypothetical protein
LYICGFRFASGTTLAAICVHGRMSEVDAIHIAYGLASGRGREPWLFSIRTFAAPRPTPRLDAFCRRHTAFATFLDLLTAPAFYRPSIRLDLLGRDGARLAQAYDRVQAAWGDPRRAFITGLVEEQGAP